MAHQSSSSEGRSAAPRKRARRRKPPVTFGLLIKLLQVVGLVIEVLNGLRDLLNG